MAGFPRKGIKPGGTSQASSRHVPQGLKPGRKRRRRGFPQAPSGAGRGVDSRIVRICAERYTDTLRGATGYTL